MTALDQAIIKAYLRHGGLPAEGEIEVAQPLPVDIAAGPGVRELRQPEPSLSSGQQQTAGTVWPGSGPIDALELSGSRLFAEISGAIECAGFKISAGTDANAPDQDDSLRDACVESSGSDGASSGLFQPALRIDAVSWPRPSRRLRQAASKQIERLADAVRTKAAMGGRVVGVAGSAHGEGCTTVLLTLAMRLAELGMKILLLDGDVTKPTLPEQLALANEVGWRDVVLGAISLEDAVTQSDSESVALLPYCGQATPADGPEPSHQAVTAFLDRMRGCYDTVLVDLGGALAGSDGSGGLAGKLAEQIDSVLTVYDVRATSRSDLAALRQRFRRLGIAETGIVENFVDDETASGRRTNKKA